MNCFEIQEKIIDLVLGELTSEDEWLIREHIDRCPICREELTFLSECMNTCSFDETETCECQFEETYWEDFAVTMHERISHEKIEKGFPYHIVIPVAASALFAVILGYFVFFRPSPKQVVEEEPSYQQYDPYDEIHDLSPEEREEFIKIINQRYGE